MSDTKTQLNTISLSVSDDGDYGYNLDAPNVTLVGTPLDKAQLLGTFLACVEIMRLEYCKSQPDADRFTKLVERSRQACFEHLLAAKLAKRGDAAPHEAKRGEVRE